MNNVPANVVLDKWQEEVMNTEGNIVLRSGRQVGKSFIIGLKAAKYALENEKKLVMVISKTEKQAYLLFSKILHNLVRIAPNKLKKGRDRPTKHVINLLNGTSIYCLATGESGYGIMGFTIDLLIADEAAFIPETVWNAVIPAMTVTKGAIWLLSTPFVKEGYYYKCFSDPTFTAFHTTSEQCSRRDDAFLAREKERMTKAQYAQWYLGEFVDELKRFFTEELILKICTGKRPESVNPEGRYYYGADVGTINDEFTHEIVELRDDYILHRENIITKGEPLPESARKILELDKKYHFKKEFIDSGGMGIGVCQVLRETSSQRYKVIEINNASRSYTSDDKKKTLMKEELYVNLKSLMERGKIQLLDDEEIKDSLRSIQAEFNDRGRLVISGRYTHVAEGLIRACWCTQSKALKLFCA